MAPSAKASKGAGAGGNKKTKKEETAQQQTGLKSFFGGNKAAPVAEKPAGAVEEASRPRTGLKNFFIPKDAAAGSEKPPVTVDEAATNDGESAATGASQLDKTQMSLIEEKRRLALERKQMMKGVGGETSTTDTTSPAKSPTKSCSAVTDNTPEKLACPLQEKRHSPTVARRGVDEEQGGKFARLSCGDWMQYNNFYNVRLNRLRGAAREEARALWGGCVSSEGFSGDLEAYRQACNRGDNDVGEAVLVGLIFKELKSRPNVIEMYNGVLGSLPETPADDKKLNLCSDDDLLWLEDGTTRMELVLPKEQIARLATGFVVAVRGVPTKDGKFRVTGLCFARVPLPPPLPIATNSTSHSPYIALVSGLAFGATDSDGSLVAARTRAADYLLGQRENGSNELPFRQLIICGGLFDAPSLLTSARKNTLEEANTFLARLAGSLGVDVMPANGDPTNLSLPQMPLHPHLFRRMREFSSFKSVSNPYNCSVDGLHALGHSGQPVEDLLRCTQSQTPLQALETCLEGLHIAPTAPDTLSTQPFSKEDPFIIDPVPHVLFSGGHDKEAHSWHPAPMGESGTMCVCVPAFHKHPAVVLVNLQNPRDVQVVQLGDAHIEGTGQQ